MYKDIICERVHLCKKNEFPLMIHEFKNSFFVLGDHQFYKGYSLLYLKEHIRELHDIPKPEYLELSAELYEASLAIEKTLNPWKINVMCIGNQTPHIHWHIVPRFESDKNHKELPMYDVTRGEVNISEYATSPSDCSELIEQIKSNL